MWETKKFKRATPSSLNLEEEYIAPRSRQSGSTSSLQILASTPAENVGEVLERHKDMFHRLRDLGTSILSDPSVPNFGKRCYAFKALASAVRDLQLGERMAWGIKDEVSQSAQVVMVGFGPPIIDAEKAIS